MLIAGISSNLAKLFFFLLNDPSLNFGSVLICISLRTKVFPPDDFFGEFAALIWLRNLCPQIPAVIANKMTPPDTDPMSIQ